MLLTVIAPEKFSVSVWPLTPPLPSVYAAADEVSKRIVFTVIPFRLIVVLAFPALLNVAVSPVPGGPPALQLVLVDHVVFVVPFQVALAAWAEPRAISTAMATIVQREREEILKVG